MNPHVPNGLPELAAILIVALVVLVVAMRITTGIDCTAGMQQWGC